MYIAIKKTIINNGIKHDINVFNIKIESANRVALKLAKKQSNDIIVSVDWPTYWPSEKVDVIYFG